MPTKADREEIRQRGVLIVRRHLRKIVDPSRLVLMKEKKEKGESGWPGWHLYLDGDWGKEVCYIGYSTKDDIQIRISSGIYKTFREAERDDDLKDELVSRVKTLIGAGGGE